MFVLINVDVEIIQLIFPKYWEDFHSFNGEDAADEFMYAGGRSRFNQ